MGWCEEEFVQTGQDFHTRGKRLNDMIPALRALWAGGWVEYHGTHYDVPPCQMNPSPTRRCPSSAVGTPRRAAAGLHPVRRMDQHRRGPPRRGLRPGWEDHGRPQAGGAAERAVLRLPGRPGLPRPRPVPPARGRRGDRPPVRAVDGRRGHRARHARVDPRRRLAHVRAVRRAHHRRWAEPDGAVGPGTATGHRAGASPKVERPRSREEP